MVERSICIREAPGSIPGFSSFFLLVKNSFTELVQRIFKEDPGELAQMVERSLSMREVPGSMPGFSILKDWFCAMLYILV